MHRQRNRIAFPPELEDTLTIFLFREDVSAEESKTVDITKIRESGYMIVRQREQKLYGKNGEEETEVRC